MKLEPSVAQFAVADDEACHSERQAPTSVSIRLGIDGSRPSGIVERNEPLEAPRPGQEQIEELLFRFEMGDYLGALALSDSLLGTRPVLLMPRELTPRLGVAEREAFLLQIIDGLTNLEEVVDASGLPMVEALRSLCSLVQKRIIELA
jgi:hypothetical protein